jgi:D-glycero-beta-D-manno-heptose 1-phosphate adenylyltransferase
MGRFISDWNLLKSEIETRKSQKPKCRVVFTNGCFDILHVGHVRYLQEARALGDLLVMAVNTDRSVSALKGPSRPVNSEAARGEVLAALGCVDFVTLFDQPTPIDIIKHLRPDLLVKGGDWRPDQIVGSDFVATYGGKVQSLNFVDGFSTTQIIAKASKP